MATAKKVGAQPILTANYGSGTPKEAADWVKYANVDKGYGVKYWEIGNEVYGNGHYGNGKGWETDNHADKSPKEYGKNLVAYSKAMKAVDPKVKIGAVLTTPGFWPDAEKAPGDTADWNNTVLSIAGRSIDFVIVHWYPGGTTTADLLNTPSRIAGVRSSLRSLIAKYAGPDAASVEIAVTETDAVGSPALTSQAAALFAPDTYMTWFEQGATHVDWWNLHNGTGEARRLSSGTYSSWASGCRSGTASRAFS
jgi:alpha-L-arabinofuranosidase